MCRFESGDAIAVGTTGFKVRNEGATFAKVYFSDFSI